MRKCLVMIVMIRGVLAIHSMCGITYGRTSLEPVWRLEAGPYKVGVYLEEA